jgi:hypothetical protein
MDFVTNNDMVVVPYSPYSMILKGRRFETVSDMQRESQAVLDSIKENDFHAVLEAWKKRWNRCIYSQGDYFEGDGSQNSVS